MLPLWTLKLSDSRALEKAQNTKIFGTGQVNQPTCQRAGWTPLLTVRESICKQRGSWISNHSCNSSLEIRKGGGNLVCHLEAKGSWDCGVSMYISWWSHPGVIKLKQNSTALAQPRRRGWRAALPSGKELHSFSFTFYATPSPNLFPWFGDRAPKSSPPVLRKDTGIFSVLCMDFFFQQNSCSGEIQTTNLKYIITF